MLSLFPDDTDFSKELATLELPHHTTEELAYAN